MENLISFWDLLVRWSIKLFLIRIQIKIINGAVNLVLFPILVAIFIICACIEGKRARKREEQNNRRRD